MVKSMTGFGRAETDGREARISVEIRSVNHRYLDMSLRTPRCLAAVEGQIRGIVKKYVQRGKLDLTIQMVFHDIGGSLLSYNEALAGEFVSYARQISQAYDLPFDLTAGKVAAFPEVLVTGDASLDDEALWELVKEPLEEACRKFSDAREREGKHLAEDLLAKLDLLEGLVEKVQERSPQILEAYQARLRQKLDDVLGQAGLDENRIAAEVIIYADKICNDEETVRLMSHIHGMRAMLQKEEGIGRKLDFLAQEMNREANTILSKSADLEVSNLAIEIKTEIEKIREQVQNLE